MAESAAAVPGEASPPLRELKAAILMLVETLKAHDAHLVEQAARQEVQQRQLQRHSHPGRSDGEKPTADWSHRFTRLTPPGLRRRPAYIVRYGIAVHVYAKEAGRVSSQAGGAADGAGRSAYIYNHELAAGPWHCHSPCRRASGVSRCDAATMDAEPWRIFARCGNSKICWHHRMHDPDRLPPWAS